MENATHNTSYDVTIGATDTQLVVIKTFTVTIAILGTLGNTIMISAILYGKLYKFSIYVKILNLLVCNLIHCAIFLPLIAIQAFTGRLMTENIVCSLISYGLFCNLGTELFGYVCISFNRYACIINQKLYNKLYGSPYLLIIEWIISWSIYPVILAFPLFGIFSHYEYAPMKLVCHPFLGVDCTGYCLFVFLFAILTTVPVIGFCYLQIILVYVKLQRKIASSRDNSKNSTGSGSQTSIERKSGHGSKYMTHRKKAEIKMAFIILAIILFFGMCRLPFITLYIYDPSMVKVDPLIHTLVIYIGSNLNWINPIVYALTNTQIRHSLQSMVTAWKRKIFPTKF
ncbi:G-protein coupled receptor moody-like [Ruditapes philippinarum]|uniref:G-protein coupled receptor moody-like n=1 Tax=Ruditapes philippinarum TaxID=129788 RepID=UPI00295B6C39|nr:G-protein coupled receptor moody-like [Ruditapes philippinarum]